MENTIFFSYLFLISSKKYFWLVKEINYLSKYYTIIEKSIVCIKNITGLLITLFLKKISRKRDLKNLNNPGDYNKVSTATHVIFRYHIYEPVVDPFISPPIVGTY